MIGAALAKLLEDFQLPTDGTLETKGASFRESVGLVSNAQR